MNATHTDQRLDFIACFDCVACKACGYIPDEFGSVVCSTCDGDTVIELKCELRFDIIPGEPPIIGGPPEMCDPGVGDEITRLAVFIGNEDKTASCRSLDEATEFIYNKWAASTSDRFDEPDYEEDAT